jgi:hypothetical protein
MKTLTAVLLFMSAVAAMAKDKRIVKVEVISANTRHWTTISHDDGSTGTQKTDCTSYDDNDATCTIKIPNDRAPSDTPIHHVQVDLEIKMPDGTSVRAHCRVGTWIWSSVTTCVEPSLGKYDAMIEKHDLRLLIPVQRRRAAEIKFSFE